MQIIIPKFVGFCNGVENTVNMAKQLAKEKGEVFTYGKLIHNDIVIDELKTYKIFPIDDIDEIIKKDNILIRTHGTTKEEYEKLLASGKNVVDGTCPFVKKIHRTVKEYSDKGYHIIIFGDTEHPEVKGIKSYCKNYTVLTDIDNNFSFEISDKYFVVSQTTQDYLQFEKFIEKFKNFNKYLDKIVEFMNTICYTTSVRQYQAIDVAKKSQILLVLGDKNSSNTTKLYDLAKKYCETVYFITNVTELLSVANKNITYLGILTGASTPKELIMEVLKRMADKNNTINNEEVNATVATNDVAETPVNETVEIKVIETVEEKKAEPFTMEQALKKYSNKKNIREGSKVKATVVSIEDTGLMVSVSGLAKNDSGFIDKDELELDTVYDKANFQVGQEIETIVIPKNPNDKNNKGLNLSKKKLDALKIDDEAVKQILEGAEFTLACNQEIKGGLLGKLGSYSIFVPASQIKMGFVKNLKDFVDKPLRLKALPPKEEVNEEGDAKHQRNNKRIVASQRIILEEEKKAKEEAFWSIMQINNIVTGKVKRFSAFGAFVQVMGFDCLAHISDLSWTKIKEPAEVLELGKSYDFVVLKADKEANKVSIGFKQLQKKPYEVAADKYPVGTVINGKVERIFPFGAFVEIEPGIDGLVHVSQIGHKFIKNASEALKIGEEIQAKIIGFENNKITLSIKELLDAPESNDNNSDSYEDKPARKRFKKDRDDNEPREWVSNNNGATLADLFKDLDLEFKDE